MTEEHPPPVEYDGLPEVKGVQIRNRDRIATVQNGLEAAKNEDGVSTDVDALVELAEAYTGWSA